MPQQTPGHPGQRNMWYSTKQKDTSNRREYVRSSCAFGLLGARHTMPESSQTGRRRGTFYPQVQLPGADRVRHERFCQHRQNVLSSKEMHEFHANMAPSHYIESYY